MNIQTFNDDYTNQLSKAIQFIEEHDDFLVVSHVNPDGDAASSSFAMGMILQHLNKQYTMINEGKIPGKFSYMKGSSKMIDYSSEQVGRQFNYVISVDCADYARIGEVRQCFSPQVKLLNIDHHLTNDFFGEVQLINPNAAATAEVLFDLIEEMEVAWTEPLATCIYTGLLTDTGGFRYANTSPKVMEMAAKLLTYGVRGHQIAEELLEKLSLPQILILKLALSTLSFTMDNRIGWLSVSLEDMVKTKASNEDLEGLVNYPRNIEGVEVGLLFKQLEKQQVKVSLRSTGKVDVGVFAQQLGGGGHARAAGCTLAGSLEDVIVDVLDKMGRVM